MSMNLESIAERRAQQRELRRINLANSNPLIKNAILDDDEESGWLQNTFDGVVNGVPAVAVSATLSFANTAIALGNAFGGNMEELQTDDTLRALGLNQSADYYNEHSQGIDAIGFIAGAVTGGGVAIKGLRALQKGYAISSSNRFISGLGRLANAPEDVAIAANQIRTGAAASKVLTNQNMRLLSRSVAQYSLEGAAASYLPLLTQNQSPFLNNNDLGYFDSVKANFKDATFDAFIVSPVFGALGGVFNYGKLRKAVKDVRSNEQAILSDYVDPIAKSMYSTEGDVVAATSKEYSKVTDQIAVFEKQGLEGTISETDKTLTLPALKRLQDRIKIEHEKSLKNIVSGDDADIQELATAWNAGDKIGVSADLFAGARSVTRVAPVKPSALPDRVGLLDDIAEDLKGIDDTVTTENVLSVIHGNKGFRSEVYEQAAREMDLINSADNKFASQLLFKDVKGNNIEYITKQISNMEKADRELNPAIWQEADSFMNKYKGKDISKLTNAERLKYAAERSEYMGLTSLPNQFQRVVGSALGKDGIKVTRKYSDLFKFFGENGHTAKYVNGNSLFVDTLTGNTFAERVLPTVGDYGNVKLTRNLTGGRTLKFGNYSADVGPGKYQLASSKNFTSLNDLSNTARDKTLREMNAFAIESEAQFVAAQMDKSFNVSKEIGKQDLPYLERALVELQNNPSIRAKVKDVGELDATQLTNYIKETKQGLINQYADDSLLGKAGWSQDQLERMLQVDQDFILSGQGNFIGLSRDLTKPRHMKINYGINLSEELPDAEARLASVRNTISEQHKLASVAAAKEVSPTFSGVLSTLEENLGRIDTDLTSVAPGYLTASYAEYGTFASRAKFIGAALHKGKLEVRQEVASNIIPLATTVAKNPAALKEANAIIERSRMGLYKSSEGMLENANIFLNDLANRLPPTSQLGNISKRLGNISDNINNRVNSGALTSYVPKDLSDTIATHVNNLTDTLQEMASEGANVERLNSKIARQMATFDNDLSRMERYFDDLIPIHSPEVLNWVNGHKQLNGQYIKGRTTLDNVLGKVNTYDPETLYLGNPSIAGKFVGFVESPNMVQTGTKRHILIADSAEELNQQIKVVNENYPEYSVFTSKEREAYAQAKANYEGGTWNFDPKFNAELGRKGSVGKFNPRTDRVELENATNSLIGRHTKLLTDAVETHFAEDMARLDTLANRLDNLYGGQVGNGSSGLNFMKNNPARATQNIIRDRATANEFQNMAEGFVSGAIDKIGNAIKSVVTGKQRLTDQDFTQLQEISQKAGYTHAPVRAVTELVMESNPPTEAAKKLISVVNGAAVLTMHRADTFMPILNALGNVVLGNAEYSRIVKSITTNEFPDWVIKNSGNLELSPAKALSSAMSDVFGNMDEYLTRYESMGLNVRAAKMHQQLREAFAEDFGNFTVNKIQDTMAKWGDMVSKINGSNAIDDFNRAVTARVADKLALQSGLVEGSLDHRAFIHNFISNVEGTVISSQRPQLFNGVVGQAIGLFQSYSLHMGQSLFRNLADGNKRYALQVLSMNGTLFGANSLPGWQQVNQHLIERSNGNFSSLQADVNDALGTDLGDLITYGSVSNILHLGIYNRGRIDVPFINTLGGDMSEKLPAVAILGRAVGAVTNTARNLATNGYDGSYMLEGLSMIGINRPIGELAQIAQGYTLTRKGNVGIYNRTESFDDYVSDKANWAELGWNIMGAAMGAKNLDSSIALDQYYKSYQATAAANAKLADIGSTIKARIRSGDPITPEDMQQFMTKYVSLGKDKKNFDKWMINQMMSAKESQVSAMSSNLTTAGGMQMQRLMGGSDSNIYNSTFWE